MADADRGRIVDRQQRHVGTIAVQIGYESEAAFSRAFKKMIGVAPSAWRRTILEARAAAS